MCCELVLADPDALPEHLRNQPHHSTHHDYAALPEAAPAARHFVASVTRNALDADTQHTAVLLTSETVTNAVIHARTPLQVGVTIWPTHVLIAVGDHNPDLPQGRDHDPDRPNGRGIPLLDALAQTWGVTTHTDGKTTWFTLPRPPPTP